MDHICIANKRNGLRCTKRKVNDRFCKIHTTNERCNTSSSNDISSIHFMMEFFLKLERERRSNV